MQQDGAVWPVIIIGAGAAGLLAGIFAGRQGARVLLLETRRQPGAKIRVSGGSRCNVLPSVATRDDFFTSGSTNALRNILFSWPLADVTRFFSDDLDIPLKVEATGKVFPQSDRSKDIVDGLLRALREANAELRGNSEVARITYTASVDPDTKSAAPFAVHLSDGTVLHARNVIMACGGLSLPKTGSNGSGWRMAKRLGHGMQATHAALVPLLSRDDAWRELAGLATPARLEAHHEGRLLERIDGDFLFTHQGYSGPSVLNVSRYLAASNGQDVKLTATFGDASLDWDALLKSNTGTVGPLVRQHLPRRLADTLVQRAHVSPERRLSELSRAERTRLVAQLQKCALSVTGDEGYRTAEVTVGGIPLDEVNTKSLESRKVPGLYFVGEMLDVTGRLGGYNFLWAWVTGRRAGQAAAARAA